MNDSNANNVSYVRKSMVEQSAPPVAETGVIKWVRENLFSSWMNIILTLLSLYVIYLALALVLPWAFGGVWNAGSLTECREVLFSFYRGSHDGACWAVIEDRWLQITFGFYPPDQYWRPILAFVLFFVALAPILFSEKVPGKLILFSCAYPFLAAWLIWGGSFWVPLFAAFGFILAFLVAKFLGKITGPIVTNLLALVAALLWWGVAMTPVTESLNKMIGNSRFDVTLSTLETRTTDLPAEVAALEARVDEKATEIAAAEVVKNEILTGMVEIRIEEFAVSQQIEPKEDAFQRLDAAQETVEDLAALLADWNGAPVAVDESEVAIADAEFATVTIDGLIGDVADLLGDASSELLENTAEPALVAELMVADAAVADPSILEDVASMVAKTALTDPLIGLTERAEAITPQTSQDELSALRADIETLMASLTANLSSLTSIYDKVVATNVDALVAPQAEMLKQMATLAALRDDATLLSQETFRSASELSNGRSYLTSLRSLKERDANLPEMAASTAALRDALPSNQRNMISISQLPDGASTEETDALKLYLDARNTELNAQASVRDTYAELGRVGLTPIDSRQIGGFMLALIIGIAGIVLSLPLGVLLALGRQSHLFFVNKICVAFIEVIRGVPLIVWLFTASLLLNYFLPPGSNFDLMLRVIIMVTLFSSAYIAEVIRGGLAALPTGQYEGADSLGLSYWQSMQLIILPQAMKISIPGIVNSFIGLFKDTVLVVFIGLLDPIGLSNAIRADTDWNGVYWELFAFIGLLFFIFCFSMGRYSLYLEKKLQREHR